MTVGLTALIAGSLCVVVYTIVILLFRIAWKRAGRLPEATESLPHISLVVPFRNEAANLPALLTALHNQDYPSNCIEVILVDDHSVDASARVITDYIGELGNFFLLKNTSSGKKSALKAGILRASGELILTTDADCIPHTGWLNATARAYSAQKPALLIGPVRMVPGQSIFSRFQALDFMSLQMAGAGAAIIKNAVFCSGANLAFRKEDWISVSRRMDGVQTASGDDVFLLHALKKEGMPIQFIKEQSAMVSTATEESLSGFLKQRMRWGGKSRFYTDFFTIFLALLVLITNLYLALSLLILPWLPHYYAFFAIPFVLKYLADFSLLKSGEDFFGLPVEPLPFLLFSLFYPFYIVIAGIAGLLVTPAWKTREHKKRN